MLGMVSVGHAQMSGGLGGGVPGTAYGGATDPSALELKDGFRIIPSIMVGERYDSNVFFAPKDQLGGLDPEDFVTTTIPQVRGLYAGSLFKVNATAAAVGEYYAKNTGLSYVGFNGGIFLDMSQLASRLGEGSRLTVSDGYSHTPQPPAFLIGDVAGAATNPFLTGIQASRVNTTSNTFGANLAIPLTQLVSLIGSYASGFIKFGQSDVTQVGTLQDQTYQTYMAGLSMKISPLDTLSLNLISSEFDMGSQGAFSTRGATVGWSRVFTPSVSLISAAGAQLVENTLSGSQGAFASTSIIAPIGSLALLWRDSTTTMTLAYNVNVAPSFFFESQPLVTNVASFTLTQQAAIPELLALVSLNYGRGDEIGGSSSSATAFSYSSYGGVGGVTYKLTPKTFLGLTYSYSNFDQTFGGQPFRFDRQVVQFSLTQAFY